MKKPDTDWTLETATGITDWWANYTTLENMFSTLSIRQLRVFAELQAVNYFAKTQENTTTALKIIAERYPRPLSIS